MSDDVGVVTTDARTEPAPKRKRDGRLDQPGTAPLVPDTSSDARAGRAATEGSALAAEDDMAAKRKAGRDCTPTKDAEPVAAEAIKSPPKGGAGGRIFAKDPVVTSRADKPTGSKTKPHPVRTGPDRSSFCNSIAASYAPHTITPTCISCLAPCVQAMARCYNRRFFAVERSALCLSCAPTTTLPLNTGDPLLPGPPTLETLPAPRPPRTMYQSLRGG